MHLFTHAYIRSSKPLCKSLTIDPKHRFLKLPTYVHTHSHPYSLVNFTAYMYRFMLYATNVSTVFQFCKEGNYDTAWKMVIGRSVG